MEMSFPGGKKVEASYKGFLIKTDQPKSQGGDETAPTPFDLFLASMGACAGIYVLGFFEQRGLPTEGLKLVLSTERTPDGKMLSKVKIAIKLPPGFPQKHRESVVRSAELCLVARHLKQPPVVEVSAG